MASIFSIDLGRDCVRITGQAVKCDVKSLPNGTISTFGDYGKSELPGDPDIAGIGVLVGFFAACFLTILLGLITMVKNSYRLKHPHGLPGSSSRSYGLALRGQNPKPTTGLPDDHLKSTRFETNELVLSLMVAFADAQMLLMLAYSINFWLRSRCTILLYHFRIVLYMNLTCCATFVVVALLLPEFWGRSGTRQMISTVLRTLFMAAVFILCLINLLAQANVKDGQFPARNPPGNTTSSMMLLPTACFLDRNVRPYALLENHTEILRNVEPYEEANSASQMLEFRLACTLTVCFVFALVWQGVYWWLNSKWEAGIDGMNYSTESRPRTQKRPGCCPMFTITLWFVVWCVCFGVAAYSCYHVFHLRNWVDRSGWLQPSDTGANPESEFVGVGQMVSVVAFVGRILV